MSEQDAAAKIIARIIARSSPGGPEMNPLARAIGAQACDQFFFEGRILSDKKEVFFCYRHILTGQRVAINEKEQGWVENTKQGPQTHRNTGCVLTRRP